MMAFDKTGKMLSEIYKEGMASVAVTFELRSPPDCRAYFNSATIPCYGRNRSTILLVPVALPALSGRDFGDLHSIPCTTST